MSISKDVYAKLHDLGLKLPSPPPRGGIYLPAKSFASGLVYVSGCGPAIDGQAVLGKLGRQLTVEQGQAMAKNCMLNVLAVLEAHLGDLNRVRQVVKITVFVASSDEFYEQPKVANSGSALLADLFGEQAGTPSRSAIGVNVLPGNIPVEIEALFECEDQDYTN
jgi:enamine deaminase RidA (YjgF/YER057c/UK114 family)